MASYARILFHWTSDPKCERVGTESRERAEVLRQGLPERTGQAEALAEQRRREVEASQREARAEVARLEALQLQKVSQEQQDARSQAQAERAADALVLLAMRCQNRYQDPDAAAVEVVCKLPDDLRQVVEDIRQKLDAQETPGRMHDLVTQAFRENPASGERVVRDIEQAKAEQAAGLQREQPQERDKRAERDDDLSM